MSARLSEDTATVQTMDADVLRATNTQILNQVGKPPPTSVLLAVLEATGGRVPDAIYAHLYTLGGTTKWRIEGIAAEVAFVVYAHKEGEHWSGGQLEDDGMGDEVSAFVHALATVVSASYELTRAIGSPMGASDAANVGQWTFYFSDRTSFKVVTDKDAGRNVADAILKALHRS